MCFQDKLLLNVLEFGQRIRQARERRGMSQEELAALVSRDQRAISEYEHGKRKVAASDLPTFARVLNVPILYFFDGELTVNDLDRAVIEEFQRLPSAEVKRYAVELVRLLGAAVNIQRSE